MRHIEIKAGAGAGNSYVKVDGDKLPRVRKVALNMGLDDIPTVTVEMLTTDAHFEGDAQINVREVATVPNLRKRLEDALANTDSADWQVLVVAVELPTGHIETIANHGYAQIVKKLEYYRDTYDHEMRLKHNRNIGIIDFMLV